MCMHLLVVQEVRAGDAHLADRRLEFLDGVPILPVSREILELAEDLIIVGPIPRNADAAHIAIASVYGCEYLLTGIAATLPTPSCSGRYGVSSTGMGMRRRACAPRKN